MKIPLEDLFEDIVGKAQRGLQVSDQELGQRAGLAIEELRPLKKGSGTLSAVPGLAEALGLGPKSLAASYSSTWYPADVPEFEGAKQFNTPLIDMTVNAWRSPYNLPVGRLVLDCAMARCTSSMIACAGVMRWPPRPSLSRN